MVVSTEEVLRRNSLSEAAVKSSTQEVKREIEVVEGVGSIHIDLNLTIPNGEIDVRDGFLIEVFESGSDGKLTRVYKKDVIDPFTGDVLREGFKNYLILKVDK